MPWQWVYRWGGFTIKDKVKNDFITQPAALETARQYARDAISGAIVVGNYVRLACERFLKDLDHALDRGIYFDEEAAQHAVDFFGFLRHSKGIWAKRKETAGFLLAPWQIFIIANLFGWYRLDTGTRRFREAHIEVARKNGKSTLLSGVGLYMLVADGEPGADIFTAATTKEQASIIFKEAFHMVDTSPFLKPRVSKSGTEKRPLNLHVESTFSKMGPLAADATNLDGLNVHCALLDELHEHPTRALYDVLNTGTGSRSQPLILAITTAGFDREGICWDQRTYGVKVLREITPDDNFFVFIATLDDGDSWEDEKVWPKANPNLGVSISLEAIRPNFIKAKEQPAALNEFLRKHLNVWTSSDTAYMLAGVWEKNCVAGEFADPVKLRYEALLRLKGRRCFGGLDMSSVQDITAYVLVFPPCDVVVSPRCESGMGFVQMKGTKEIKYLPEGNIVQLIQMKAADRTDQAPPNHPVETLQQRDDKWNILSWFWIPEAFAEARAKHNRAPYDAWIRAGFIDKTQGTAVDQEAIRNKILWSREQFRVGEIGYDEWETGWVAPKLLTDGLKMMKIPQRFELLSGPCKSLAAFAAGQLLEHFNNPVLRWMVSNVQLKLDSNGNQRADKGASKNKIDGVIAMHMALGRALANPIPSNADSVDRFKVRML